MHKNDRRCGYAAEIYARTQDAQKVNLSAMQESIGTLFQVRNRLTFLNKK